MWWVERKEHEYMSSPTLNPKGPEFKDRVDAS
jgi:hypothetical protein